MSRGEKGVRQRREPPRATGLRPAARLPQRRPLSLRGRQRVGRLWHAHARRGLRIGAVARPVPRAVRAVRCSVSRTVGATCPSCRRYRRRLVHVHVYWAFRLARGRRLARLLVLLVLLQLVVVELLELLVLLLVAVKMLVLQLLLLWW